MHTDKFIVQSFERLLKTMSFEQITVKKILTECGISRSTFYRHFSDKYELLSWYYTRHVDQLLSEFIRGNYRDLLISIFIFMRDNKYYYQRILDVEGQNSFWSFLKNYSDEYYLTQLKKERAPTRRDCQQIDFISVGDVHSVRKWVREGCLQPPEELADFIISMIPSALNCVL